MRVNAHKRRRLVAQQSPAPDAPPSGSTSPSDTEAACEPHTDADRLAIAERLPPRAVPPRTLAQILAEHGRDAAFGIQPPLTPPLGHVRPAMPPQPPPLPPSPAQAPTSAPALHAARFSPRPASPAAPAQAAPTPEPLNALAQLRLQQGMTVDQWRSTAVASLDEATNLLALRDALIEAQVTLAMLPDRPAWRSRRSATQETLVEQATQRMTELAAHAGDVVAMVPIYRALQLLAPDVFADKRDAFLAAVGRVGEAIFSRAGQDIATLEHAFTAFENSLTPMDVGFDKAADTALRQALVSSLWYRLLEAPEALSTWSIQTWTGRSQSLCHLRPCPQIAALVWLRAFLSMPSLNVEHCVKLTTQLREAWAVPDAPTSTEPAARPTHLPSELAFEPAARTQLTTWVAVLTDQLPALAPFQADPVREAFSQLAEALHIHIDIEIGLPATDGDADMQARELADFIREWERDHRRPFPGYEALFNGELDADADPDDGVAAGTLRPAQLGDFFPHEDFLGAEHWPPVTTRPQTPYAELSDGPTRGQDITDEVDWLAHSPAGLLSPPPDYSSRQATPPPARQHAPNAAASPSDSDSEYSSVPDVGSDVDSDWS